MSKIILKKAPAIAPRGNQPAVFTIAKQETGTNAKGVEYNDITVNVQLEAKDASGQPYQVSKTYHLAGRGFSAFCEDFESWSGRALTQDEIEGFDPDVLIKGQKVVVEIAHRENGKVVIPVIKGFGRANVEAQVAS